MSEQEEKFADSVGSDHSLITEIFNELTSGGFLEQLRVECVADVKTKPTYLKLKQRFVDLLNKKIVDPDWKSESKAPRLNIFREQVIECGVLAVTIERVVDEVVRWKVQEEILSLIKEILCARFGSRNANKFKLDGIATENSNPTQREEVIKQICESIHVDWKHVFKDGYIGNSLATVSFSTSLSQQSDEEPSSPSTDSFNSSNISPINSDNEMPFEEVPKGPSKQKKQVSKKMETTKGMNRTKRERKQNSKYCSDLYFCPVFSKPEPPESSTPISSPAKKRHSPVDNCNVKKIPKKEESTKKFEDTKSSVQTSLNLESKTTEKKAKVPKLILSRKQIHLKTGRTITELKINAENTTLRKSERQPKPNSRIFWEPGGSVDKSKILPPELDDIERMKVRPPEMDDIEQINNSLLVDATPKKSGNLTSQKKDKDTPKKKPPPEASSQRYATSELYKPRPVITSKAERSSNATKRHSRKVPK